MEGLRKLEKVCQILQQNNRDPSRLIPILQAVQEEYRYLPEEILTFVAVSLNLTPARVYGVATFYSHFTLIPKGKYIIRICDGTACHVKKSTGLLEAMRQKLGLKDNVMTTPDMLFTIETVSCLGACGLAPVIVVDDEVHGQMTPGKAVALIDEILKKEERLNGGAVTRS
ncbi:MAG: NAD(P)H-dependent oxidoreductase subunit E [Candidatus Omnitrophica bacterium]|nr:NAD(P)H-dependent oxidoreductase subunit E [Candidatus Omnitrophota bacterium]